MSPQEPEMNGSTAAGYVAFPHLDSDATRDGQPVLNRHSTFITRDHDFPPAKAMLYAAGVPDEHAMQTSPQIGIASVWWEGNPCNMHLGDLAATIQKSVQQEGFLGWRYNTIGVSDGITMGNEGMRFSLQSREIIADSIETMTCAQAHDACIAIPGCDKNMPGCVMGLIRHNRPSVVVYGGTQRGGYSKTLSRPIDINTPSEARGAYILGKLIEWAPNQQHSAEEIISDIEKNSVPGPGACGGMYTANSLATVIETLGLSVPGSSSSPAMSPAKLRECDRMGGVIRTCLEKNIRPLDILTRQAFENALTMMMVVGGSTNSVLHILAMARTADVDLSLDDFQRVSSKTPFLANMAPSGKHTMEDLFDIGGIPSVMKLLVAAKLLDGSTLTVTGKTLAENVESWPSLPQGQEIIRSLDNPIKPSGHIEILKGNIAPGGAVAKITGKEGLCFEGKAMVYDKEHQLCTALDRGDVPRDENVVLVVRYEGPKGGPGMPEQLRASGTLIGGGFKNVALITDGRYSGASHGFIVGHIVPEAAVGGPLAVVQNGDVIRIDAVNHRIEMPNVTDEEIQRRMQAWKPPKLPIRKGTLAKYAHLVSNASYGAVTDAF
ncbi:dihydroxy-acid dehydratase [Colletotrichum truncatum]|uniref:Dihydroxy-acid dehydratase n=1 Tax=Colletotrichum truncatum TaxID=5467 RepID=A0ACC3YZ10_COLTU|nr:dihydroxy-acid dehydratase [Colletotrichum truncatum]KAF6781750.1 dihydroxy-acid dehydratase [Colletotrichum truncatum]